MSSSTLDDFAILATLGQGSFGTVFKVERLVRSTSGKKTSTLAKKKLSRKVYVMKQIQLNQMSKEEQFEAVNECKIMASLKSKYIVKYYDSFIDKTTLNIIMEYCNRGDLQQYLSGFRQQAKNNKSMPETLIWKFLLEMACGLFYLHSQKILHRDIKTANVFLSTSSKAGVPSLKIGDLGVAKMLNSTKSYAASVVGTPYYLSPELCANKPYNKQSDVWALGCILYECCTFEHPFDAGNQGALVLKIMRGRYEPISMEYSHDLRIIVKDLLNKDMKKRLTLKRLFSRRCVIDQSEKLGIEIPFIDTTGKDYLKYMQVGRVQTHDIDIESNVSKTVGSVGRHDTRKNNLEGNIRGGRVRGRKQTRILAALPSEMISGTSNAPHKSPPLKKNKMNAKKSLEERKRWKTKPEEAAVPVLKESQRPYMYNNFLNFDKLKAMAGIDHNDKHARSNYKRPTVKELRALIENDAPTHDDKEKAVNIEANADTLKADITVVENSDTPGDNDVARLYDKDQIQEDNVDDTFSDNEIVPIYNTHCVLINDDEDDMLDNSCCGDGLEGSHGESVIKDIEYIIEEKSCVEIEGKENSKDLSCTNMSGTHSSIWSSDDDESKEKEEFSQTLTFKIDYKVL